jgi:hypothetical protein
MKKPATIAITPNHTSEMRGLVESSIVKISRGVGTAPFTKANTPVDFVGSALLRWIFVNAALMSVPGKVVHCGSKTMPSSP